MTGHAAAGTDRMEVAPAKPDIRDDPALFAALTPGERGVLCAHLTSGWYKQSVVYPVLSVAWWETAALLDDIHHAREAARGRP